MSQIFKFCALLVIIAFSIGCDQDDSSKNNLDEVKDILNNASSIKYSYSRETDNIFNGTNYSDSADITYFKMDSSLYGFALHALSGDEEYLFDGYNFEKLNHSNKIRVKYDMDNTENDSNYFNRLSFFSANPMNILEYNTFGLIIDSTISGQAFVIYKTENQSISKSDDSQIVKNQKFIFVALGSKDVCRICNITMRNDETLQIENHHFTNFIYNNFVSDFSSFEENEKLNYEIVNEEDENKEFTYTPIQEGERLTKKAYIDVDQKEVNIYGESTKSSLIMFSFIGCTPCEIALKDFKEADYKFTDQINLYYSSFQNSSFILKKYLNKKGFPFKAFGKESKMIDDFSLYHAPSFVLIGPSGKIVKVIEGYDEEVKHFLFELLAST